MNLNTVTQGSPSLNRANPGLKDAILSGLRDRSDIIWFWIGHHSEHDRIIAGRRG